jgi:hypothetical protein
VIDGERRYGNDRAVGGKHSNWPRRTCRNAVLMSDEGLRIAQCWFGVEREGKDIVTSGNKAGFGPPSFDFEEGCWRKNVPFVILTMGGEE